MKNVFIVVCTIVLTAIVTYYSMIYNLKIDNVNVTEHTVDIEDITGNINVYEY